MSVDGAPDAAFCVRCTRHPAACECEAVSVPRIPTMPFGPPSGGLELDCGNSGNATGVPIPWDPPMPLEYPPLPNLPVERLGRLSHFVTAAAESLQTSVDLVAFAALATISTATGGRRVVEVRPDWVESVALYLVALADSSERKTPALATAANPLREVELKRG